MQITIDGLVYRVLLDGEEVEHCVAADSVAGEVEVVKSAMLLTGEVSTEMHYGKVEIYKNEVLIGSHYAKLETFTASDAPRRWDATVTYRTEGDPVSVRRQLEELGDIHDLVEAGPHWDSVVEIRIVRANHTDSPTLTIKQAEEL